MKEDLGLYGDQLNWFTTFFQVGYIVGQIPSNILLTRISPRWYLPAAEFLWSLLVLFVYKCQSAKQIYVLRFFIGFVEAASWPGLHFMIGTWYRNHEINKRSGIITAAGIAATMFSGYIQAGIYTTMDGHLGLRGWRWLFIVVLGRWHFWILCTWFSLMYFVYQAPTTSTMALWLKAEKYSVVDINNFPTVYSALSIVFMLGSGVYNDWRGSRVESVVLICITQIISESILTAWDVTKSAKFFAYYIAGTIQSLFPIIVSWTHQVCAGDAEERAIVIASLNSIGLAQGTWWNQVFVPTVEAPRFKRGYRAGLAASLALTAWTPVPGYGAYQPACQLIFSIRGMIMSFLPSTLLRRFCPAQCYVRLEARFRCQLTGWTPALALSLYANQVPMHVTEISEQCKEDESSWSPLPAIGPEKGHECGGFVDSRVKSCIAGNQWTSRNAKDPSRDILYS
ncbi:hypothetical protein M8818_004002 [Zalaria obscura]|uniref:Uncharacterized protein n=1 Tax=Zalaria obscura TaxID=2024903 RepID=A0ACC3SD86_9PEZI